MKYKKDLYKKTETCANKGGVISWCFKIIKQGKSIF